MDYLFVARARSKGMKEKRASQGVKKKEKEKGQKHENFMNVNLHLLVDGQKHKNVVNVKLYLSVGGGNVLKSTGSMQSSK